MNYPNFGKFFKKLRCFSILTISAPFAPLLRFFRTRICASFTFARTARSARSHWVDRSGRGKFFGLGILVRKFRAFGSDPRAGEAGPTPPPTRDVRYGRYGSIRSIRAVRTVRAVRTARAVRTVRTARAYQAARVVRANVKLAHILRADGFWTIFPVRVRGNNGRGVQKNSGPASAARGLRSPNGCIGPP